MWYLLNNIQSGKRRDVSVLVEQFNSRHAVMSPDSDALTEAETPLTSFAPTIILMKRNADGTYVPHSIPLLFHYVFVKGELSSVKKLCSEPNGLSFVLRRMGERTTPVTVQDHEIHAFSIIARSLAGQLPVIMASQVELIDGDEVEVISGPFQGLGGIFHPRRGSRSGTLTVTSGAGLSALVTDISVDKLKVIRFANDSRRPYDLIDAFTPRMLSALRLYGTGQALDSSLLAPLVSFTRRMDGVTVDNPKLNAKLQLHLLGAWTMLGNNERAAHSRRRFETLSRSLTNPQARALASLVTGVIDHDDSLLRHGRHIVDELKPSVMNSRLIDEFSFWDQSSPRKMQMI